jgi:hypothetical protein
MISLWNKYTNEFIPTVKFKIPFTKYSFTSYIRFSKYHLLGIRWITIRFFGRMFVWDLFDISFPAPSYKERWLLVLFNKSIN